ncbi:MAG: NYN domain-containing protein [Bacteroidales bacterium]|nr:NYN domain-containing protein [Bacteroidales bacterium]
MPERTNIYIDGFNLYFGIKDSGWNDTLWLDLHSFSTSFIKIDQQLNQVKYFTSRVRNNPPKEKRQGIFLEAIDTLDRIAIFYGHYQLRTESCRKCGHTYQYSNEKMTDVNIAVELLCDAFNNQFDTAILISGDSDLVPPIKAVKSIFPEKRIIVAFPPNRFNNIMKLNADGIIYINRSRLINSQMPEIVIKPDGFELKRPETWK